MATFVKHQQEFGGANRVLVAVVARERRHVHARVLRGAEERRPTRSSSCRASTAAGCSRCSRRTCATPRWSRTASPRATSFRTTSRRRREGLDGRAAQHPQGRHRRPAGGQRLLGRDRQRRADGVRPRRRASASTSSRWRRRSRRACARSSTPTSLPGSTPCESSPAHHRLRQGDGRHRRRRAARGRCSSSVTLPAHRRARLPVRAVAPARGRWCSTCAVVAVVWQLGILTLLGFGIDPMSILVPFLVFAIAVSHGVQMISSVRVGDLRRRRQHRRRPATSFRRLLVPGGIALATDVIGFVTILFIQIRVIQEIAIAASIGVAAIILTNLVLLPVAAVVRPGSTRGYRERLHRRARHLERAVAPLLGGDRRAARRSAIVAVAAAARRLRRRGRGGRCRSATCTAACRSCGPTRATTPTPR